MPCSLFLWLAQTPSPDDSGLHTLRQPYAIEAFGAFRMPILEGDFCPKVALGAAMARHPTTGIGAVADARGEITIHDGKLIVSYGKEGSHPRPRPKPSRCSRSARSPNGRQSRSSRTLRDGIDNFIARAAGADGIDPFPFQIRGTLASYVMQVNAAATNGPHGMGQPIAVTMELKGAMLLKA